MDLVFPPLTSEEKCQTAVNKRVTKTLQACYIFIYQSFDTFPLRQKLRFSFFVTSPNIKLLYYGNND